MAKTKDPVVAEIQKIRRKISKRLATAAEKGRLYEELGAMDRHADQVLACSSLKSQHGSRGG
jgi:hypothetical protein